MYHNQDGFAVPRGHDASRSGFQPMEEPTPALQARLHQAFMTRLLLTSGGRPTSLVRGRLTANDIVPMLDRPNQLC